MMGDEDDYDFSDDEPSAKRRRRKPPKPTKTTPATFGNEVNWDCVENGPNNPTPQLGAVTYVGFGTTHRSGRGRSYKEDSLCRVKTVLDILRSKGGYRCELPPPGWVTNRNPNDQDPDPEVQFLKENYDTILVKDIADDVAAFHISTMAGDWIAIRCSTPEGASFVETELDEDYALIPLVHEEVTEKISGTNKKGRNNLNLSVTRRTGNESDTKETTISASNISTMFELKQGTKVIAKSLCTYEDNEVATPGPTVEILETAIEWRRHGYGSILMDYIESYFKNLFDELQIDAIIDEDHPDYKVWGKDQGNVKFNVCNCCNLKAHQFFRSHGFRGGEEMRKSLYGD